MKIIVGVLLIAVLLLLPPFPTFWQEGPSEDNLKKAYLQEIAKSQDTRVAKIEGYFSRWNLPALAYAEEFIFWADQFNLPPFLVPAITMQESSGGKAAIYNNWWGINCDLRCIRFPSVSEGIRYVSAMLAGVGENGKYYKDKTLEQKLATYNDWDYVGQINFIMEQISSVEIQPELPDSSQ